MARRFLGYGRQSIDDTDIAAVVDVLRGDYSRRVLLSSGLRRPWRSGQARGTR